jgi:hypothetical protein
MRLRKHANWWGAALLFTLPLVSGCIDPSDLIVYADHIPAFFRMSTGPKPAAFTNPFDDKKLQADDPQTRILVKTSAGIGIPEGTRPYGQVAWGKYFILGNHGAAVEGGQRFGVFDSETRSFCELRLDPASEASAAVPWLGVAEPDKRQTRIYFGGSLVEGYQFGYVDADMDNPDPCDPVTGWPVVGFTGQDLNCAAAGLPLGCEADDVCAVAGLGSGCDPNVLPAELNPCPHLAGLGGNTCLLDGMTVLDPQTVVLANYIFGRIFVARVAAASGALSVPDVYQTPLWSGPNGGPPCYGLWPVGALIPDRTRSLSCSGSNAPCTGDADCPGGSCLPDYRWAAVYDLATLPGCPAPLKRPAQEFRFDGTTIVPTSDPFVAPAGSFSPTGPYDSAGNLWLGGPSGCSVSRAACTADADCPAGQTCAHGSAVYFRLGNGHGYDYDDNAGGVTTVTPEQVIGFESLNVYSFPGALQVDGRVYFVTRDSLQRANNAFGVWGADTAFKLTLGTSTLAAERGACSASGAACGKTADCGAGGVCRFGCLTCNGPFCQLSGATCDDQGLACPAGQQCVDAANVNAKYQLAAGGSPRSLWTALGFTDAGPKQTYLARMPVTTALPDPVADSRPGIAWSGGDCASHPRQCRLWLFAMKDGAMRYRVRDDSFWSGWYALPGGVVTDGPGVVSDGTTVEVYARGTADGKVYRSVLTSPITCSAGTCAWSGWYALPGALSTPSAVAATMTPQGAFVAVRSAADDKVWFSRRQGASWTPWTSVEGLVTDAPPSVTYRPSSNAVHFAARETGSGVVKIARVAGGTVYPWAEVGASSALAPWGSAPAVVESNGILHLFVAKAGFPQYVYEAMNDGGGWGNWRRLRSESIATKQPAAADVNGDVDLVTSWSTAGLAEESPQ